MKKILLIIVVVISVASYSFAQTPSWVWAKSAGTISSEYGNATCTDANGNVYITGTFQGSTITFGNYTLSNTATGELDAFVVKYDANGNVIWATSGGGSDKDYPYGICTDLNGNVYITGYYFSTSLSFGGNTISNTGSCDVFIVKFDSIGNAVWLRGNNGISCERGWSICSDTYNNIYVTGEFDSDTLSFGNISITKEDYYDIFVVKYDAGGNVLWVKSAGGNDADGGIGICSDTSNNIYVTGYFQTSAIFDGDTISELGSSTMFLAKYNSNGNLIWVRKALKTPGTGNRVNVGYKIVADKNSGIYITGYFQTSINIGNDSLSNPGQWGIFLAKYDNNGNALWGRSPGGTNNDFGQGICTNENGNVFITGYFASSFLNFGGFPVLNANAGYMDIYVAEYNPNGNAVWAESVGQSDFDYGMGICSSGNNVYVTGYFGSYSLDFGSTTITNNGSYDTFLAKLGIPTGIEENSSLQWNIFPNPSSGSFSIFFPNQIANGKIEILTTLGTNVFTENISNESEKEINLKNVSSGIYFVKVFDGEKMFTQKIIIQ